MTVKKNALEILKQTSRTFYIPINRLPSGLREAVASAYLCMRAIDEVEDHPELDNRAKVKLLRTMSLNLQAGRENTAFSDFWSGLDMGNYPLDEVSLRLDEWVLG